MEHRWALLCLSLAALSSTVLAAPASSSWNDNRYRESARDYEDYNQKYGEYPRSRDAAPLTHTYTSPAKCADVCANPCTSTTVYLDDQEIPMYTCDKLKPPKTLKGNSFYLSLAVIGVIVVGIVVLITLCFCCSYCCRNPSSAESSRGSSKQALAHNEDGEFKEYLNGTGSANGNSGLISGMSNGNGHHANGHHHHVDDIGAMKRERDFARRPRPVPQIV